MSLTSPKTNSLLVLLTGAVLLAGVALHLVGGGVTENNRSVYSSSARGRSTAFELLHELDFDVRVWDAAPGQLPEGRALLISPGIPETPAHYGAANLSGDQEEPAPAPQAAPEAGGLLDPAHYGHFVRSGGTLLLTAGEGVPDFLERVFELSVPEELLLAGIPEQTPWPLAQLADVALDTGWNSESRLVGLEDFEPLITDVDGAALASERSLGSGRLVLLADDALLQNENLSLPGCALAVVRLVEELAPDGVVLFDEYVLGGWAPDSPLDLAFGPSVFPFSLHLVLLLLSAVWIQAWARAFPRDPVRIDAVSAGLRARGLAGLLAGAGRWNLLASMLRRGVLRRLAARSGLHAHSGIQRESPGRAPDHASGSVDDPAEAYVRAALAPLLIGRERMALDQAVRIFTGARADTREDLEALSRELTELESATKERPGET